MGKKRLFIVILITVAVLALLSKCWLSDKIIISFNSNAAKAVQYQVFYTEADGQKLNEKQSIAKNIAAGAQRVKIELPVPKIVKFRLDFGVAPGKVEISNLKLLGKNKIRLKDFNDFAFNSQIESKIIEKNKLTINSGQRDPFIIYKKELNFGSGLKIDWYILIILSTLSFLCAYKIVQYLAQFKLQELRSRIDIVFICCFFGLLYIPMSHMTNAEKSTQENRMLAKYPQIIRGGVLNDKFGEQFEKWYNDRFGGRSWLISLYTQLKYYIAPQSGNNKVLVGKDGWLFFKLDNGMANYANKVKLSPAQLKTGQKYLDDFNQWCQKNNKQFVYVIAPDKSKIYGEYYRLAKKMKPDNEGIGQQFNNYIKKNSRVKIVYFYDILFKNKAEGLLYYKNDTHWSMLGAYYGYQEVMKILAQTLDVSPFIVTSWIEKPRQRGDLSDMYSVMDKSVYAKTNYKIPNIKNKANCKVSAKYNNTRGLEECKNPLALSNYRVLILGDSFSDNMMEYYNQTFAKAVKHRKHQITKEDLQNIMSNYDIVVLENVERYTSKILTLQFPKD